MPDLTDIIQNAIDKTLSDINIAMPAEIISYDSQTYTCSVKPVINKEYLDGLVIEYPVINNLPVLYPRTNIGQIHMPLKAGDKIQLLINQRDLDKYLEEGRIAPPNTNRKFNLQDAVVILGLYDNSQNPDTDESLTVRYSNAFLKITESNEVQINASNITITGNVTIDGTATITNALDVQDTINASGDISTTSDVTAGSVSLSSHTHGGVQSGGANTLPPN